MASHFRPAAQTGRKKVQVCCRCVFLQIIL